MTALEIKELAKTEAFLRNIPDAAKLRRHLMADGVYVPGVELSTFTHSPTSRGTYILTNVDPFSILDAAAVTQEDFRFIGINHVGQTIDTVISLVPHRDGQLAWRERGDPDARVFPIVFDSKQRAEVNCQSRQARACEIAADLLELESSLVYAFDSKLLGEKAQDLSIPLIVDSISQYAHRLSLQGVKVIRKLEDELYTPTGAAQFVCLPWAAYSKHTQLTDIKYSWTPIGSEATHSVYVRLYPTERSEFVWMPWVQQPNGAWDLQYWDDELMFASLPRFQRPRLFYSAAECRRYVRTNNFVYPVTELTKIKPLAAQISPPMIHASEFKRKTPLDMPVLMADKTPGVTKRTIEEDHFPVTNTTYVLRTTDPYYDGTSNSTKLTTVDIVTYDSYNSPKSKTLRNAVSVDMDEVTGMLSLIGQTPVEELLYPREFVNFQEVSDFYLVGLKPAKLTEEGKTHQLMNRAYGGLKPLSDILADLSKTPMSPKGPQASTGPKRKGDEADVEERTDQPKGHRETQEVDEKERKARREMKEAFDKSVLEFFDKHFKRMPHSSWSVISSSDGKEVALILAQQDVPYYAKIHETTEEHASLWEALGLDTKTNKVLWRNTPPSPFNIKLIDKGHDFVWQLHWATSTDTRYLRAGHSKLHQWVPTIAGAEERKHAVADTLVLPDYSHTHVGPVFPFDKVLEACAVRGRNCFILYDIAREGDAPNKRVGTYVLGNYQLHKDGPMSIVHTYFFWDDTGNIRSVALPEDQGFWAHNAKELALISGASASATSERESKQTVLRMTIEKHFGSNLSGEVPIDFVRLTQSQLGQLAKLRDGVIPTIVLPPFPLTVPLTRFVIYHEVVDPAVPGASIPLYVYGFGSSKDQVLHAEFVFKPILATRRYGVFVQLLPGDVSFAKYAPDANSGFTHFRHPRDLYPYMEASDDGVTALNARQVINKWIAERARAEAWSGGLRELLPPEEKKDKPKDPKDEKKGKAASDSKDYTFPTLEGRPSIAHILFSNLRENEWTHFIVASEAKPKEGTDKVWDTIGLSTAPPFEPIYLVAKQKIGSRTYIRHVRFLPHNAREHTYTAKFMPDHELTPHEEAAISHADWKEIGQGTFQIDSKLKFLGNEREVITHWVHKYLPDHTSLMERMPHAEWLIPLVYGHLLPPNLTFVDWTPRFTLRPYPKLPPNTFSIYRPSGAPSNQFVVFGNVVIMGVEQQLHTLFHVDRITVVSGVVGEMPLLDDNFVRPVLRAHEELSKGMDERLRGHKDRDYLDVVRFWASKIVPTAMVRLEFRPLGKTEERWDRLTNYWIPFRIDYEEEDSSPPPNPFSLSSSSKPKPKIRPKATILDKFSYGPMSFAYRIWNILPKDHFCLYARKFIDRSTQQAIWLGERPKDEPAGFDRLGICLLAKFQDKGVLTSCHMFFGIHDVESGQMPRIFVLPMPSHHVSASQIAEGDNTVRGEFDYIPGQPLFEQHDFRPIRQVRPLDLDDQLIEAALDWAHAFFGGGKNPLKRFHWESAEDFTTKFWSIHDPTYPPPPASDMSLDMSDDDKESKEGKREIKQPVVNIDAYSPDKKFIPVLTQTNWFTKERVPRGFYTAFRTNLYPIDTQEFKVGEVVHVFARSYTSQNVYHAWFLRKTGTSQAWVHFGLQDCELGHPDTKWQFRAPGKPFDPQLEANATTPAIVQAWLNHRGIDLKDNPPNGWMYVEPTFSDDEDYPRYTYTAEETAPKRKPPRSDTYDPDDIFDPPGAKLKRQREDDGDGKEVKSQDDPLPGLDYKIPVYKGQPNVSRIIYEALSRDSWTYYFMDLETHMSKFQTNPVTPIYVVFRCMDGQTSLFNHVCFLPPGLIGSVKWTVKLMPDAEFTLPKQAEFLDRDTEDGDWTTFKFEAKNDHGETDIIEVARGWINEHLARRTIPRLKIPHVQWLREVLEKPGHLPAGSISEGAGGHPHIRLSPYPRLPPNSFTVYRRPQSENDELIVVGSGENASNGLNQMPIHVYLSITTTQLVRDTPPKPSVRFFYYNDNGYFVPMPNKTLREKLNKAVTGNSDRDKLNVALAWAACEIDSGVPSKLKYIPFTERDGAADELTEEKKQKADSVYVAEETAPNIKRKAGSDTYDPDDIFEALATPAKRPAVKQGWFDAYLEEYMKEDHYPIPTYPGYPNISREVYGSMAWPASNEPRYEWAFYHMRSETNTPKGGSRPTTPVYAVIRYLDDSIRENVFNHFCFYPPSSTPSTWTVQIMLDSSFTKKQLTKVAGQSLTKSKDKRNSFEYTVQDEKMTTYDIIRTWFDKNWNARENPLMKEIPDAKWFRTHFCDRENLIHDLLLPSWISDDDSGGVRIDVPPYPQLPPNSFSVYEIYRSNHVMMVFGTGKATKDDRQLRIHVGFDIMVDYDRESSEPPIHSVKLHYYHDHDYFQPAPEEISALEEKLVKLIPVDAKIIDDLERLKMIRAWAEINERGFISHLQYVPLKYQVHSQTGDKFAIGPMTEAMKKERAKKKKEKEEEEKKKKEKKKESRPKTKWGDGEPITVHTRFLTGEPFTFHDTVGQHRYGDEDEPFEEIDGYDDEADEDGIGGHTYSRKFGDKFWTNKELAERHKTENKFLIDEPSAPKSSSDMDEKDDDEPKQERKHDSYPVPYAGEQIAVNFTGSADQLKSELVRMWDEHKLNHVGALKFTIRDDIALPRKELHIFTKWNLTSSSFTLKFAEQVDGSDLKDFPLTDKTIGWLRIQSGEMKMRCLYDTTTPTRVPFYCTFAKPPLSSLLIVSKDTAVLLDDAKTNTALAQAFIEYGLNKHLFSSLCLYSGDYESLPRDKVSLLAEWRFAKPPVAAPAPAPAPAPREEVKEKPKPKPKKPKAPKTNIRVGMKATFRSVSSGVFRQEISGTPIYLPENVARVTDVKRNGKEITVKFEKGGQGTYTRRKEGHWDHKGDKTKRFHGYYIDFTAA